MRDRRGAARQETSRQVPQSPDCYTGRRYSQECAFFQSIEISDSSGDEGLVSIVTLSGAREK